MGDSGDPRGSRGKYWYIGADALFTLSAATAIVAAINFLRSGPDSTAEIETKMVGFVPSGQGRGGGGGPAGEVLRWANHRRLRPSMVLAVLALSGTACDWREFDQILAKAPVLSVGAPDGYQARDVGRVVLPLTVPPGRPDVTARFLVAGTETPSLGLVELDAAGRARSYAASALEIMDMAGEAKASVKSAVELEDRRILLGAPAYSPGFQASVTGRLYFLELGESGGGMKFEVTRGMDPGANRLNFGLGVAAGKVSGGPAEDWVVASLRDVTLLEDGRETAPIASSCDLSIEESALEKYRFRALAIGDFVSGGDREIAVGVPRDATGRGRVVILSKVGPALDCLLTISAPGEQPRFGTALAVADFNDDGNLDLLVGAPPQRAFLYRGPLSSDMSPALELKHPTLMDSSPTGDFGFRVLGFDVDGAAGREIVVSAPELPIGGKTGSGQVFVFRQNGSLLTPVQDYSPEAEASFGFSLSALRFAPSGCGSQRSVLLVGSIREVFAFFRVPEGLPDPRCL